MKLQLSEAGWGWGAVYASQQQVQSEGQVTAGHREESGSRLEAEQQQNHF